MVTSETMDVERSEILAWINTKLQLNLIKFEQAYSGSVLCKLMNSVHPGTVPMDKVNMDEKDEEEMIQNYSILRSVLETLQITTNIEVNELVKGRHLINLKFMQEMKTYCDSISEILSWINSKLNLNLTKFEEAYSGAVIGQLLDSVHPANFLKDKVILDAKNENERKENYKVLQYVSDKLQLTKYIDVNKLVNGRPLDNMNFMHWIKSYCDSLGDVQNRMLAKDEPNPRKARYITPETQEECITEISIKLCISRDSAFSLLIHYKWSVDIVIEAWSSNEEQVRRTVGLPNVTYKCFICFESYPSDRMYSAVCGHQFCKSCWEAYMRTSIRNGPECLLLRCPHALCDAAVGQDMIYLLVSDEEKKMYSRYILRSHAEANSKMYYIQQHIMRTSTMLSVSKGAAGILLRHFKWSINDVLNAWFDNEVDVRKKVGLMENPTVHYPDADTELNSRKCSKVYPRSMMFCASCGHLFCTSCWSGYIGKSIHGGPDCLMLRCLEDTCNAAVDQDMVYSIVSDSEKEVYNNHILRSYIEDNREGLAQMFTEPKFECYGDCATNNEDDILKLSPQALSDTPADSIISRIDAPQETVHTYTKDFNEGAVMNQTYPSASTTKKGAVGRKRKAEGRSIDDRRPKSPRAKEKEGD